MNGTSSHSSKPKVKASDYLVGHHLDEALANGEQLDVFWPFSSGTIKEWTQAEALWYIGAPEFIFYLVDLSLQETHSL